MAVSGFRQVIITEKAKLSYSNNYLIVRQVYETKRIFLDEIEFIIVENPACSISAFLQVELAKRNIKLLYCDGSHNPVAELMPLYGSYDCSQKLAQQI
jgi:CRISPR/Cas system-associated endonuclease Cas1